MPRLLNTLPPELILQLRPHLEPLDHFNLILSSRSLYHTLGPTNLDCRETLLARRQASTDSSGYFKVCGTCIRLRSFWHFPLEPPFESVRHGIYHCIDCWGTAGPRHAVWFFGLMLATSSNVTGGRSESSMFCRDKNGCGATKWGRECNFAKDAIPGAPAGAIRSRLDQLEKILPHQWAAGKQEDWINMQWETVVMEMEDAVRDLGLKVPPAVVAPPQLKSELEDGEAEARRLKALRIRQMCGWMGLPSWVLLVKETQAISVVQSVGNV